VAADPWKQLLSVATLGVTRAAPDPQALWPPGIAPLPAASAADTVLRAGITGYLWRTAGGRAPPGPAPQGQPPPAPARRAVPEAAAWRLARMLTGFNRELVPQWLAIAEGAQRELPVHWLPTVLPCLTQEERQQSAAVLGPRAVWLGEQNPRWRITPPAPSEELWTGGTLDERLQQLILMRQEDPDAARERLLQSWPSETPDGRAKLIPALYTRLTPADEVFLEQALDDRRKEVRAVAADCLLRLPASAHARRNEARLDTLITAGKSKGLALRIELPATLDKSGHRDGLEAKPPRGLGVGERTWWLSQMVARTRPAWWTQRFNCGAGDFIAALERTEHGPALIAALADAARLHPDPEWARVLCRWLALGEEEAANRARHLPGVLSALSPAEQQPLLEKLLAGPPTPSHELLYELLGAELAWTPTATERALSRLGKELPKHGWSVSAPLFNFARRAPVGPAQEALAALLAALPADASGRESLTGMAEILDFRATMTRELLADG
jgi:hypothetical protein